MTDDTEDLWPIERAARYLGLPPGTLYQWHHRRTGPPAYRVGRYLRYDPVEVRAWLRDRRAA
jgi:excisionase family DNA binding protein